MFILKILKNFLKTFTVFTISIFIILNIPYVQKEIISTVVKYSNQNNNFKIQFDDCFIKYFHIIKIKNLRVQKEDKTEIISLKSLKININPIKLIFERTISFSDLYFSSISCDITKFLSSGGENKNKNIFQKILKFFLIEINNLRISDSHFFIDKNIQIVNTNAHINTIKISKNYIRFNVASLTCNNEYLNITSLTIDFLFYFFRKSFFVKQLFIETNYGKFDGSFNLKNVDSLINKNFNNIVLNIKANNATLKFQEINKYIKLKKNISDLYFSGNLTVKNNILETENITLKYLQSFLNIKIFAKNIFNYNKIEYKINCDNGFFSVSDFKQFFNIEKFYIFDNTKFCKFNYFIEGNFYTCKIKIGFNINGGDIVCNLNLQKEKISQNFFIFPYINGKMFLKNNKLDFFINNFLNLDTEVDFYCDFLQKKFQGSLLAKKIQYKKYIFENIKYSYSYGDKIFNGHILAENKTLNCDLKHSVLFVNNEQRFDIYGYLNSKYLLDIFLKKNIFDISDLKFNINCTLKKKDNNIDINLDISNLYFCYFNHNIKDEKINLKLKIFNNHINFICDSNFYDIKIESVPIDIIKNLIYHNGAFYDILKEHVGSYNYKINTRILLKNDLFLNHFLKGKFIFKNIEIKGFLENKNKEISSTLDCYCKDEFSIYKKKIKNLNFNILFAIKKNEQNTLTFEHKIKSNNFHFMNNEISFFNDFNVKMGLYNFSLKVIKDKKINFLETKIYFKKNNNSFFINFDKNDISLKILNEPISFKGGLEINKKNINAKNFRIAYKRNEQICYVNGIFDLKNKKAEDFTIICTNVRLKTFNLFFDKNFDGILNCDINKIKYNFSLKNAEYKNIKYGDIFLNGYLQDNNYKIALKNLEENQEICSAKCTYCQNKTFDVDMLLNNFNVSKISPLTKNIFETFSGLINGKFKITGTFDNPQFSGMGNFSNGFIKVKFLKTKIDNIFSKIICENNKIILKNIKSTDKAKGEFSCTGEFLFKKLTKPEIFFSGNLINFLLINNHKNECPYFYGEGYLSGDFKIYGPFENIHIDANLSTNTSKICFFIQETNHNNNIHIINSKIDFINEYFYKTNKKKFNSIFLNLNFNISKNLEVTLELNESNKIIAHGIGNIKINTDCKNEFQIFGTYTLFDGFYNLNLYNVLNRNFTIKNGGILSFHGDFNSSKINVNTETIVEDVEYDSKKQDLNLNVNFFGNLLIPNISLSIRTLSGNELQINNSTQDKNNLNDNLKQFLNIFLFKSLNKENTVNINSKTAIDDFFSRQISSVIQKNFFKKISNNKVGIDVKFTNILDNKKIKDKIKYKLSCKITDNLLFYKYGNFMDFDSLMKNMAFKWMFNKNCSALFTIFPTGENLETYNKYASLGFVVEL